MANMSYCRFQNTQGDLRDCVDALGDELSKDEARAARRMYKLCQEFIANVDEYGIIEEEDGASEPTLRIHSMSVHKILHGVEHDHDEDSEDEDEA